MAKVPHMPLPKRRCAYPRCGRKFQPITKHQKYHKDSCRVIHWQSTHVRLFVTPKEARRFLKERIPA